MRAYPSNPSGTITETSNEPFSSRGVQVVPRANAERHVRDGLARADEFHFFLRYSGWGPGQLEDEIARNAWLTVEAHPDVIFETPVAERLSRAYGLLGIDPAFLSSSAGHA